MGASLRVHARARAGGVCVVAKRPYSHIDKSSRAARRWACVRDPEGEPGTLTLDRRMKTSSRTGARACK